MIPSEISFKTKRATEDFNDLKELFEMHQESYMLRVKARVQDLERENQKLKEMVSSIDRQERSFEAA